MTKAGRLFAERFVMNVKNIHALKRFKFLNHIWRQILIIINGQVFLHQIYKNLYFKPFIIRLTAKRARACRFFFRAR